MNKKTLDSLTPLKQEDLKLGLIVTQIGWVGKEQKLVTRKYTINQRDLDSEHLTGLYYLDSRRTKTISNTFYDKEILARLPDGSLYLKMGTKRQNYQDDLNYDEISHIIESETGHSQLPKNQTEKLD